MFVEGVGAVGLFAHCCMGRYNYLWNSDAGPASRARLSNISFYYPIQLRWRLCSPIFVLVEDVGAVGLSAHGEIKHHYTENVLPS